MPVLTLDGHLGQPVAIDLCHACQAFWFDSYESLQLSPASVLHLFRAIGEHSTAAVSPLSETSACPICKMRLVPTRDQQRQTRFEYRRCPQRHGRLISFFNFLREKDFVRPLSAAQRAELRKTVQTVNCSNCGAPVDLGTGKACDHCGSPLSMLDLGQTGALVTKLREASGHDAKHIDPALPLALDRARREVTTAFAAFDQEPGWFNHASSAGLISAALSSISKWLAKA
jgi:Zn-finger nucleic acid-binding protein